MKVCFPTIYSVRITWQVDQECRDQIRNKWVAAPGATAKYADIDDYPSRVLARLNRREPIRVPDHNPQGESPTFSPCEVYGEEIGQLRVPKVFPGCSMYT
jgi:hypothetical protein